jgi:hypothetical protein
MDYTKFDEPAIRAWHKQQVSLIYGQYKLGKHSFKSYKAFLRSSLIDWKFEPEAIDSFLKKSTYNTHLNRYKRSKEAFEAQLDGLAEGDEMLKEKETEIDRRLDYYRDLNSELPDYSGFKGKLRWVADHSPELFLLAMVGIIIFMVIKMSV